MLFHAYDRHRSVLVAAAAKPPPDLPPQLQHVYLETSRRHRVDAVRRCIHGADLQRVLVFMNYQQTLQVRHMRNMCQLGCVVMFTKSQPIPQVSRLTHATHEIEPSSSGNVTGVLSFGFIRLVR